MKIQCFNCGRLSDNPYPLCTKCTPSTIDKKSSCSVCGIESSEFVDQCPACIEAGFDFISNYSLFTYSGLAKEILTQYKFKNDHIFALYYAKLIKKHIEDNFTDFIVVPVPTSRLKRKLNNGYQLDDIVLELKKMGIDVSLILQKKFSKTQKKLGKDARKENLKNSFRLNRRLPEAKNIILLDDVFTTGATINECSNILKEKYQSIYSITLYRD